jgi:4-amino-4-deoxy-L-arabinose transferase-like glycosyltransferase
MSAPPPLEAPLGPAASAPARTHWSAHPAWVLGAWAAWLLFTLWLRPLMLPDEGRYAWVGWEMWLGDGLLPTLDGLPYFHKPPLTYWIGMAGLSLFGPVPAALRLAPALGAWLMGTALWLAVRRWHGPRGADIALLALATNPLVFVGAQYINHDMLVAGMITLAILGWARAFEVPGQPALRWLVAGWVACGLGFLSKGLIGAVLPLLAVGLWLLVQRRWGDVLRLAHPAGVLAGVAVAAPWMLAMQRRYPGFFDYFIIEQHFRRFSGVGFNNPQPFWFYCAVLPALTLPWALWTPAMLRRWRERGAAPTLQRSFTLLCVCWLVVVLLFFSLPRSKLVGYVLPAVPAWIALLALAAAPGRRWPLAAGAGAVLCLAALAATFAVQLPKSNADTAMALKRLVRPTDSVVFVDAMFFDIGLYAELRHPVLVAGNWDDPDLPRTDNWRKELFDAARFDAAGGRTQLWPLARLNDLTCRGVTTWLVVTGGRSSAMQDVPGAERMYRGASSELWRAPARDCMGAQH